MAMHYVYILESLTVPDHFYIGSTEDLRRSPALAGRRRTIWLCTTFTFSNRSLFPTTSTSAPSKTLAVVRPWPDEGGQYGYALRLHSRIAHCSWPLYIGSIEDLRRSPALAGRRRTVWLCTTFTFSNRSLFLATSTSAPPKTFAVVRPWPDEGGQYGYALRLHSRIAHCSWPLYIGSIEDLRRSPALAGRRRTIWLCTTFTFSNRSLFLAISTSAPPKTFASAFENITLMFWLMLPNIIPGN